MKDEEIHLLIKNGNIADKLTEITDRAVLGDLYYKLGSIYCRTYGDIEQSDKYYIQAQTIFEEHKNRIQLIHTIRDIAVNYELKGDYDKSFKRFKQCWEMSKRAKYDLGLVLASGGLGLLHRHLRSIDPNYAKDHIFDRSLFNEMREMAAKTNSQLLRENLLLGEIIELEESSRLKDKIKSQEILEKLIDSEYPVIKATAHRFLIRNYIDEFLITKSPQLFTAIKELFENARESISSNIIIKVKITVLEAKIHLVEGNLQTSKSILIDIREELQNLKKSSVFVRLEEEINLELKNLNNQYSKWKELLKTNISFEDIMQKEEIREYILQAKELLSK